MTASRSKTEAARAARYHELAETLRGLEEDLRWGLRGSERIPAGWGAILEGPAVPAKTRLTLRVDADVVAFFRAMGRGHLTRMNAVLRTFMLARLAGLLSGPEGVEYRPTLDEEYVTLRRELMDHLAAKEAAEAAAEEDRTKRARNAGLKRLKESRMGKG